MSLSLIPADTRLRRFVCVGGEVLFPVTFPFFAASDLLVTRLRAGVETTLALTTDYTVAGAGSPAGGSVTLLIAAVAGDVLAIRSAQPVARTDQFVDGAALTAAALNAQFARWWIALQQAVTAIDRRIQMSETDGPGNWVLPPAAVRASRYLAFDVTGNALIAAAGTANPPISTFAATLVDDTTPAEAQTTLGGTTTGRALFTAASASAARATIGAANIGGDTFTDSVSVQGDLTLTLASPSLILSKTNPGTNLIAGNTGANRRWEIWMGDSVNESGANAGSRWALSAFSDAGVYLGSPLVVDRATRRVQVEQAAVDSNNPLRLGEFNAAWATALRVLSVTDVASAVGQVDITLPAGWSMFQLLIGDYRPSANGNLLLRTSADGVTFASGASDYFEGGATSSISLGGAKGNDTEPGLWACSVFPGAATNPRFTVTAHKVSDWAGAAADRSVVGGYRQAAGRQLAIRLIPSAGTINRATIRLIGVQ